MGGLDVALPLSEPIPHLPPDEPGLRERIVEGLVLIRYRLNPMPLRVSVPHIARKWLSAGAIESRP